MAVGWRTVRVFISSTFRDMHAERDHLVKVVFPDLRERLERRRIHLVDIDLRWGVTQEQADNDQVLDLCLDLIDDCRPFFIGILGERYGWVPKSFPHEALSKYGWIQDLTGKSITALEIIHGVLRDPEMQMQSFFYFRDPGFTVELPEAMRPEVEAESPESTRKLVELKAEIRSSGVPVREYRARYGGLHILWRLARAELAPRDRQALEQVARDGLVDPQEYASLDDHRRRLVEQYGVVHLKDLETFGEWVRKDLWTGMCRQYPELLEEAPTETGLAAAPSPTDWLAQEQDYHERFVESRTQVYVGREAIHRELLSYVEGDTTAPLVVSGPSGSGKSAILARLYAELAGRENLALVVPHFVGASPRSTAVVHLLRRFCLSVRTVFQIPIEVPDDPSNLPAALRAFLGKVPDYQRVVIIVDALDQLDETDLAAGVHWLPSEFPPNIKIVVSCLTEADGGPVLAALRAQGHPEVRVQPMSEAECAEIIRRLPSLSAKSLDERQRALLLRNPATRNPLYLQVALEELRGFGSFEQLDARIRQFAEATDVVALFGQVLERLEVDCGEPLVQTLTCCLAASRSGLSETELRALREDADGRTEMQVVLRQLRLYLLRRDELLDYYHRALPQAVVHRYHDGTPDGDATWHVRLADYFDRIPVGPRKVHELPWQLAQASSWPRLFALLSAPTFFQSAWQADKFGVETYWAQVERSSPLRMVDAYKEVLRTPARYLHQAWPVAELLHHGGYLAEALSVRKGLTEAYRSRGERSKDLATSLGNEAIILWKQNRLDESMALLKEKEKIGRELGDDRVVYDALASQAAILYEWNDLDGAMALHAQEEPFWRRIGDKEGLSICLCNKARVLLKRGCLQEALAVYVEEEQLLRDLGDAGGLQRCLGNQGMAWSRQGKPEKAVALFKEQERICRELGNRLGVARSLANRAAEIADRMGRPTEALPLAEEAHRLAVECGAHSLTGWFEAVLRRIRSRLE